MAIALFGSSCKPICMSMSLYSRSTSSPIPRSIMPKEDFRTKLSETVFGQDKAINDIATLLEVNSRCKRDGRPLATIIISGPPGTGKTLLSKSVAENFPLLDLPQATDIVSDQFIVQAWHYGQNGGVVIPVSKTDLLGSGQDKEAYHCDEVAHVIIIEDFDGGPEWFKRYIEEGLLSGPLSNREARFQDCIVILTTNSERQPLRLALEALVDLEVRLHPLDGPARRAIAKRTAEAQLANLAIWNQCHIDLDDSALDYLGELIHQPDIHGQAIDRMTYQAISRAWRRINSVSIKPDIRWVVRRCRHCFTTGLDGHDGIEFVEGDAAVEQVHVYASRAEVQQPLELELDHEKRHPLGSDVDELDTDEEASAEMNRYHAFFEADHAETRAEGTTSVAASIRHTAKATKKMINKVPPSSHSITEECPVPVNIEPFYNSDIGLRGEAAGSKRKRPKEVALRQADRFVHDKTSRHTTTSRVKKSLKTGAIQPKTENTSLDSIGEAPLLPVHESTSLESDENCVTIGAPPLNRCVQQIKAGTGPASADLSTPGIEALMPEDADVSQNLLMSGSSSYGRNSALVASRSPLRSLQVAYKAKQSSPTHIPAGPSRDTQASKSQQPTSAFRAALYAVAREVSENHSRELRMSRNRILKNDITTTSCRSEEPVVPSPKVANTPYQQDTIHQHGIAAETPDSTQIGEPVVDTGYHRQQSKTSSMREKWDNDGGLIIQLWPLKMHDIQANDVCALIQAALKDRGYDFNAVRIRNDDDAEGHAAYIRGFVHTLVRFKLSQQAQSKVDLQTGMSRQVTKRGVDGPVDTSQGPKKHKGNSHPMEELDGALE